MATQFNFENIVRCVVRNAGRFNNAHTSESPYWFLIAELCGVGCTSAHELCERFGVDPKQKLPKASIEELAGNCYDLLDDLTLSDEDRCRSMMDLISDAARRD